MDPISGGCRLCLDPFAESFTTIENPELKDQMKKVFYFLIEVKQGFSSGVCQSCSYAISEFYQYSEKVRQNQDVLNGNLANCDTTAVDSKLPFDSVKIELLEATEDVASKPKDETSAETIEDAHFSNDESYAPSPKKSRSQRKGRPRKKKPECVKVETVETPNDSETGVPGEAEEQRNSDDDSFVPSPKKALTKPKARHRKRKLESVQVKTPSDSTIPESVEDTCEAKNDVSEEEENDHSGDDDSYEPPSKQPRPKQSASKAGESTKKKEQDELFGKYFSMVCDLCGVATGTFSGLRRHFWKEHKLRDAYVVCCKRKLSKRYTIMDHIDFHANPDGFRCELCGKNYISKITLKAHMLCIHASEDERTFKCDLCPQSFAQKGALAQHMERHTGVAKCEICDKTFASKGSLGTHMENQHSGKDRALVCDTCGKEFLNKVCFEQHVNEHVGIEVERFQCGICQRWLKGERNYRNHMGWVHNDGSREFECDICHQKYPHHRALQLHKKTHEAPKYECEFCGKKFKKPIVLKEHRTIHTGEVLYSCDYCGAPNNCSANLYAHIKRQHPTEWAQKKLMAAQKNAPS